MNQKRVVLETDSIHINVALHKETIIGEEFFLYYSNECFKFFKNNSWCLNLDLITWATVCYL